MSDDLNRTRGGSMFIRPAERVPSDAAVGEPEVVDAVTAHIERHIGAVNFVWHEMASEYVHIDVYHVLPTPDHPFQVLVTSGMSQRPMAIPADVEEKYRHAELLMCLPPNWPVSDEAFRDPRFGWPVRSLKFLARYPHAYSTWLVAGHTIPNGNPPAPLAPGTQQVALMLSFPILLGEDVHQLTTASGRVINFWSVISLYAEELELKLSEGTDALIERLGTAGLCDIVHPARPNVAAPRNPAGT